MSIIQDFIREAGWPIFPTLAFGIAALAVSIKMIEKPTEQLASLVRNLSCLTLIFGVFGTIVGLQYSVSAIEKVEPAMRWIVLIGLRETLNNLDAALLVLFPTMLCYTAGKYKLTESKP